MKLTTDKRHIIALCLVLAALMMLTGCTMPEIKTIDDEPVQTGSPAEYLQPDPVEQPVAGQLELSSGSFDTDSEEITLESFSDADLALLPEFTNLKSIDLREVDMTAAQIDKLAAALPTVRLMWNVPLGTVRADSESEVLSLEGTELPTDLGKLLGYFPELKTVFLDTPQDNALVKALMDEYPGVCFEFPVSVGGNEYRSTDKYISFEYTSPDELTALCEASGAFEGVESLKLTGTAIDLSEAEAVATAFNGASVDCELSAFGKTFSSMLEELDISGNTVDAVIIDELVDVMPNLNKLIICDSGLSYEELDALDLSYDNIRIVWNIKFKVYELRTDTTFFCASDLPWNNYGAWYLDTNDVQCLKYCRDLVALDLGHEKGIDDLSFLSGLTKLKYLIIITCGFNDISPLAGLENLEYLEIFHNDIKDLSPLLGLKNLKHLNIGYCTGFDISPVLEMTWLERLWFPGNSLTDEEKETIMTALPDTECYMPKGDANGSTGGGWREHEAYYEMRNALNMYYMGALGVNVG